MQNTIECPHCGAINRIHFLDRIHIRDMGKSTKVCVYCRNMYTLAEDIVDDETVIFAKK